jgi:hypothetical protein
MTPIPLVLQLQHLATDNSTDVTELLRKALVVATKLGLDAFREWANNELHGYDSGDVPKYRRVHADLRAMNPYRGLIPFLIHDRELQDLVCNVPIPDSIGSLGDLLANRRGSESCLMVQFSASQKQALMKMQDAFEPLEPVRTVGRNQVAAILDAVRTTILEWSLTLEADGVLGEGMTFSPDEKQRAHASIRIENFQGVFGDVTGSTVTQTNQINVRKGDFQSLRRCLTDNGVSVEDIDELEKAIREDPPPSSSTSYGEKVSAWVGKMVSKAASGAWQIGVGAASRFLAAGLASYYGL